MLRILSWIATDYAIELWFRTKVEKEPELEIGCPEVVVKLPSRGFVEFRNRFRFYNKSFVYNQVESLGSKFLTLVKNVNGHFPRDSVPPLEKLALQRHNVEPLEKSESEVVVNLIEGSDHRMSQLTSRSSWRDTIPKCRDQAPFNHQNVRDRHLSPE